MRPHIKQPWANKSLLAANLRGRHKWGGGKMGRPLFTKAPSPSPFFSHFLAPPPPPAPPPWLLHATQTIF